MSLTFENFIKRLLKGDDDQKVFRLSSTKEKRKLY